MVTDATKKLREPVAYSLLAFAGLVALASLIRLFLGDTFAMAASVTSSAVVPPGLSALVLLAALGGAVYLVTEAGERTPNARTITLVALILTGVLALLALITVVAGFSGSAEAGGKIVGFLYSLGGIALYVPVALFVYNTFNALPAPVRAPKPGQHGQFAGQGQYGAAQGGGYGDQQYGAGQQYGAQGAPAGQGQYGDTGAQYGAQGQQGQYGAQGQYGQGDQAGSQYGAYGAAAGAAGAAGVAGAAGYAAGQQSEGQAWGQSEQQPAWGQSEATEQGDAAPAAEASQWGQDANQQQWGQQAQYSAEQNQQWPSQESGQQWGQEAGQQQYGQEWPQQPAAQQGGQQGWSQQGWQQPEQSWESGAAAGTPETSATPAEGSADTEADDETRIQPPVEDKPAEQQPGGQSGQPGGDQQGWWSQPSQ
ncbi:hypothetical protein [Kribbella deserti]|uniref:Uncharacterized protein n=1 Tax=Kribbella deserti TaxID=1926257 RepID=A0ABV6QPV1_9ACTN